MAEPVVKNAADEGQVSAAGVKERLGRDRELNDLRFILSDRAGRRYLWKLLTRAKVYETIWEPSAKIHYNSGRQDFGHELLADIMDADPSAYFTMMMEAKAEDEAKKDQPKESKKEK